MIRTYEDKDYEALKDLYARKELYGGIFDEARDGRDRLRLKILQDPQAILVYEINDEIVGTISIIEDGRVAWLYRYIVLDFNQEILQKLYDAAAEIVRSRGHKEVLVYSQAGDEQLNQKYKDIGMNQGGNYTCFYKTL